jgi:hypothetical protein
MLHLLSANYDWHHHITPTSEDIRVFATIFPMVRINLIHAIVNHQANYKFQDDLFLSFTRRDATAA